MKEMKTKPGYLPFITAITAILLLVPAYQAASQEQDSPYGPYQKLHDRIRKVVKETQIKGAKVGIHVAEVESGLEIYDFNGDDALNPASGIKLLTAYGALHYLGPEFKFKTSVYKDGKTKNKQEPDNLYLKGSGDPSLETGHLRDMVALMWKKGVRKVMGDIMVDAAYFDDRNLPYGFDHNPKSDEESSFRAPVGGVSINANTLKIRVAPGAKAGGKAEVSVFPEGYAQLVNETVTSKSGKHDIKISTTTADGKMKVRVWGSVSSGSGGAVFSKRAEDPALLSGYALKQLLEERGITVKGGVKKSKTPSPAKLMARHTSEPLSSILPMVGKHSQNFYAEQLLKVLGAETAGKPGTSENGAAAVVDLLKNAGIDTANITYRNGSGLYDANFIPAVAMAGLLAHAYRSPEYRPEFLTQLAVGGVDGTLRKRQKSDDEKRHVRAKTGTLKGASSLSGYVLAPSGKKTICFSIIVNKAAGRISFFRAMQDKIVSKIANYLYSDYKKQ